MDKLTLKESNTLKNNITEKKNLNDELLQKLLNENDFKNKDELNSNKINSFLYNRTNFIIKLLDKCKNKLQESDMQLSRALDWLAEEIQESILFKSDSVSVQHLEELKKENKDLQTIFSWLEEYSTIQFKHKDSSEAKKRLKDSLKISDGLQKIPLTIVKEYLSNSLSDGIKKDHSCEELNYINCSDESISSIESPEFNIFKLESEVGKENILSTISCFIFASTGLYSKIKYDKFESFINAVAKGYRRENPYHTDLHAADVLQSCHIYLKCAEINKKLRFDELDHCAMLISCIIHDFKHPGVTNNFLINSGDPIAINYNDNYNIFSELNKDEYRIMRKRIIDCVLATDMTFHAKQFTYLKLKIEKFAINKGNNLEKLFENLDIAQVYSTQQEFMNVLIHTCDISNPTKPWNLYTVWVDKVMEEFWKQGDREKELKLPVSFLCDRDTVTKSGAQIGFIDGIIIPFLSAFVEFFPELSFLMENAVNNKAKYKSIKEKEEEAKKKVANL